MRNLLLIIFLFQASNIFGQVDWTRTNTCEYKNFNNSDLIEQLIDGMTIEEKVGQVIQGDLDFISPADVKKFKIGSVLNGGNTAPNGDKYSSVEDWKNLSKEFYEASPTYKGIKVPVLWGTDAVHGHNNVIGATLFPHNIGLGATANPDLMRSIGEAIALEVLSTGVAWTFAPTVAVPQDDRWGRTYEGFSEDPILVSKLGKAFVLGLQGEGDTLLDNNHVIATAKHFMGDGGTFEGIDQGNTRISEIGLRKLHGYPYFDALDACAQTVMASFNSWNGKKLHGYEKLLTDILKQDMQFDGFVVGDWNGHGQVPGCINTDCPQSLNAGLDMYMAPDSWKGLYESTLQHVKDGTIAIERLDDAVRRILRVKLLSGIFQKGAPSTRANAGNENLLALPEHKDVARQAVRESLVLLKNNNQLLPIDPSKTILVVGDGASSISKASGGWTLSWQGTGHSNDKFPNGESILQGIEKTVNDAGGKLIFSKDGDTTIKADVVIAVYGEDPYAEFQGDRENLAFIPNGFDTNKLSIYKENGIPIVSVFLSGRPMWANTEINNSDSFIAAWLPGSEGGGVSDMLFKTDPSFDFTGRLSFTWPASAVVSKNNNQALFEIGYGLSFTSINQIDFLSENSGLENSEIASTGEYFNKGDVVAPWDIWLISGKLEKQIASFPSSVGGLIISKTDHMAQEDALRINWTKSDGDYFRISSVKPNDLTRQSNGAMKLAFNAKSFTGSDSTLQIGQCDDSFNCDKTLEIKISDEWQEYLIPLSNFEELGIDMSKIISSILIKAEAGIDIGLGNVRLE